MKAFVGDDVYVIPNQNGYMALRELSEKIDGLHDVRIEDTEFEDVIFANLVISNVTFKNCVFKNVNMSIVGRFENVVFEHCVITGLDDWLKEEGIKVINCSVNLPPTNEEIERITGGKVFSLPNKDYVKIESTCDFCHNTFYEIQARKDAHKMLREVPLCDKRVCDSCYKNYDLASKAHGCRSYGYRGSLSFYRTPMDAINTEILGIEMEFEGEFSNWKGLQDAHRGHLHYGYDSSVRGENELSWDCGSYSYWKYLAPLEDVCKAVKEGGGSAGETAGIHIHVSTPLTNIQKVTETINKYCSTGVFRTMMEAVSLRTNRSRFETYANLDASASSHHAGISYNGHDTCEFRVFNSTLDSKLIMRHLKFCKEFYHAVKEKTPKEQIIKGFSKETKRHIMNCIRTQVKNGFIEESNANKLIEKLGE